LRSKKAKRVSGKPAAVASAVSAGKQTGGERFLHVPGTEIEEQQEGRGIFLFVQKVSGESPWQEHPQALLLCPIIRSPSTKEFAMFHRQCLAKGKRYAQTKRDHKD
jgi:hypothetical protein